MAIDKTLMDILGHGYGGKRPSPVQMPSIPRRSPQASMGFQGPLAGLPAQPEVPRQISLHRPQYRPAGTVPGIGHMGGQMQTAESAGFDLQAIKGTPTTQPVKDMSGRLSGNDPVIRTFGGNTYNLGVASDYEGLADPRAALAARLKEAVGGHMEGFAARDAASAAMDAQTYGPGTEMSAARSSMIGLRDRIAQDMAGRQGMAGDRGLSQRDARDLAEGGASRLRALDRMGRDPVTGQPAQEQGTISREEAIRTQRQEVGLLKDIAEYQSMLQDSNPEMQPAQVQAGAAIQAGRDNFEELNKTAKEIIAISTKEGLTEGTVGKLMRTVFPTSSAGRIKDKTAFIEGDAFVSSIRDLKAVGGTVGQVSNQEGQKLAAAMGVVADAGSDRERVNAIERYIRIRENSMKRLEQAYQTQFGTPFQGISGGSQESAGGNAPSSGTTTGASGREFEYAGTQ